MVAPGRLTPEKVTWLSANRKCRLVKDPPYQHRPCPALEKSAMVARDGAGSTEGANVARIHHKADGPVPPERFIAAWTDFSDRRPDLWPGLDAKFFKVHELGDTWAEITEGTDVLGGVWPRERYDWSQPGLVRLTLVDSADFRPGTEIEYRVTPNAGGCHVAVDFQRIAGSARGRLVGAVVQLTGVRRFGRELGIALDRLGQAAP